jgi:3-hydroxyisobutyrate dehydrogenase
MTSVAFLGLGAMGSRMAANILKAGYLLTVWNRTPAAAEQLVGLGARQAGTPKEAAKGADFVIAMVRDDEASRDVWLNPETGALAGLSASAIGIESYTLTPNWVRDLGTHFARQGVGFLEAPVSGSRPAAEGGQLVYLLGGDEAVAAKAEPVLKTMGSTINLVGPLGAGALTKLATNAMLGIQVAAYAEIIGWLRANGADPARSIKALSTTPVWAPVANYITSSMLSGNFAPQFPVELIDKDFRYALQVAGSPEKVPTIAAAHAVFDNGIAKGLGKLNMTGIVKLYDGDSEKG